MVKDTFGVTIKKELEFGLEALLGFSVRIRIKHWVRLAFSQFRVMGRDTVRVQFRNSVRLRIRGRMWLGSVLT